VNGAPAILVVDDERLMRQLIRTILERNGFPVITASSGAAAIGAVRRAAAIGLVVTDVLMPDMDGPTLARRLAGIKPDLPILIVTAAVKSVEDLRCPVLAKPFTSAELVRAVRALVSRGQPSRA
jgi:two-component system cell cycle sensor histidine kinase/response regulator CckA